MANKKLTEEEIAKIKELQSGRDAIIVELGNLEAYLHEVTLRKTQLYNQLDELVKEDQKTGKELSDKYGVGSINLEKGEFIPQD